MILTKPEASEIRHKLSVLCDSEDLKADYGMTTEQANELRDSVPNEGQWIVPEWGVSTVKGELYDAAHILLEQAFNAEAEKDKGEAFRLESLADALEGLADGFNHESL